MWLGVFGASLLCVAPVMAFGLLQVLLSSNVSNTTVIMLLTVCVAVFMLVGLALLVPGAHRVQLSSRGLVAFVATIQLLLACHYLAWKSGIVADFGGAAVLWLLVLVPVAVAGLVTLIRNMAPKERALWTGTVFALRAAQFATICYLWWILGGV